MVTGAGAAKGVVVAGAGAAKGVVVAGDGAAEAATTDAGCAIWLARWRAARLKDLWRWAAA